MGVESLSDHQYICFDIKEKVTPMRGRLVETVDWEVFRTCIQLRKATATRTPDECSFIHGAYNDSVKRQRSSHFGGTLTLKPSEGKLRF